MGSDLIRDLEKRKVRLSPSMKAEILQAERISNDVIALLDWFARVKATVSTACKNMFMGNTEASKG